MVYDLPDHGPRWSAQRLVARSLPDRTEMATRHRVGGFAM